MAKTKHNFQFRAAKLTNFNALFSIKLLELQCRSQKLHVNAALLFDLTMNNVNGVEAVVWLHSCAKVKILPKTFADADALVFYRQVCVVAKYGVESFPEF